MEYTVTVLTPLVITSGKKIYLDIDFVVEKGRVFIFHWNKLINSQNKETFISDFSLNKLVKLFEHQRLSWNHLVSYKLESSYKPANILPFVKNPFSKPYLPGSTLKGKLRTLYLLFQLHNQDKLKNQLLSNLKKLTSNTQLKILEEEFIKNLDVSVSDSLPVDINKLLLLPTKVCSIKERGAEFKPFTIYVEAVAAGTTFSGYFKSRKVSWKALLPKFSFIIKNIIKREIDFFTLGNYHKLVQWYEELLKKVDEQSDFYLQLGWGEGFAGKTLFSLLPVNTQAKLQKLFRIGKRPLIWHRDCGKQVIPIKGKNLYNCPFCNRKNIEFTEVQYSPFPKTRKLLLTPSEEYLPPGWIKLSLF